MVNEFGGKSASLAGREVTLSNVFFYAQSGMSNQEIINQIQSTHGITLQEHEIAPYADYARTGEARAARAQQLQLHETPSANEVLQVPREPSNGLKYAYRFTWETYDESGNLVNKSYIYQYADELQPVEDVMAGAILAVQENISGRYEPYTDSFRLDMVEHRTGKVTI